jgi:hypothetical protein
MSEPRTNSTRKILAVIAVVAIAAIVVTIPFYVLSTESSNSSHSTTSSTGTGSSTTTSTNATLPAGCVKPAGGFLIVASDLGFNDSELHYGQGSWPIVNVTQGSTVNITVCDAGNYAHGFQISNYYQSSQVTLEPGDVLHIPAFIASQSGNFLIYCSIPCPIHIYMQYGELKVTQAE